jgi:hypothetical protein
MSGIEFSTKSVQNVSELLENIGPFLQKQQIQRIHDQTLTVDSSFFSKA